MNVRIPTKQLTPEDVKEVLSLKDSDITGTLLKKYFACFYGEKEARFQPNDWFMLPKNTFYNKETIKTTIGRYLYNIFALPEPYLKKYGYLNYPLKASNIGDLETLMGNMILQDEMTTKQYAQYMDRTEWISMNCAFYITPSLDNSVVLPLKDVIKKRDDLFTQYKKEIEKGDINIANKIESELLSDAKSELKKMDDPAFDNYETGDFAFGNAYKKGSIMIGAIKDLKSNDLHILKSNYMDGVDKAEYDQTAQLTVIGGYSRGVATQDYGYESKKYNNSLQNVTVEYSDKNLDCGTDKCLEITITPELKSMFLYRFVNDNGKLVELTDENIDKYVGHPIKLRSPMFCKGDTLCQHCAGTLFKRIDISNVGFVCFNLTGNLMNLSMKKMHDSTVTVLTSNIENFITEK